MIKKLKGTCAARVPTGIILDVNGVGYDVEMPLSHLCEVRTDAVTELWIYTHVREDALRLFGFLHYEDRLAFEVLLSISGVGPKVALAILSTLTLSSLHQATLLDRREVLEAVPGIGPRLAEKIMMELKPRLKKLQFDSFPRTSRARGEEQAELFGARAEGDDAQEAQAIYEDVRSALENLGFKERDTTAVLMRLRERTEVADFSNLMRKALLELGGNQSRNSSKTAESRSF